MFLCFVVFVAVGHFSLDQSYPSNTPKAAVALLCLACLSVVGFAITWGPMVWTISGELYPSRYRAKGMALSAASNWLWNFLLALFTPFIVDKIDFRYGFFFAACNVVGGLIVFCFVVEGQGRTLEEIDTMYLVGVKPWESAEWAGPYMEEIGQRVRNC